MKSESIFISAPMSFTGSALQLWELTWSKYFFLKWLLLAPLSFTLICIAWVIVLFWYLIFGFLLVPHRLVRRSSRKNKRDKLRHREVLQAVETNPDRFVRSSKVDEGESEIRKQLHRSLRKRSQLRLSFEPYKVSTQDFLD